MSEVRRIFISEKTGNIKELKNLFKIYDNFIVKQLSDKHLEIEVSEFFDLNEFHNIREMAIEELFIDFTAFVSPLKFDFNVNEILDTLSELNPGVYPIEKFIQEIVLMNKTKLKQSLKNFYYSFVNQETIKTVIGFIEANMNASSASKKLFMHRNTLNYRLDHFIDKTEINIREFSGAMAVYLLFRR